MKSQGAMRILIVASFLLSESLGIPYAHTSLDTTDKNSNDTVLIMGKCAHPVYNQSPCVCGKLGLRKYPIVQVCHDRRQAIIFQNGPPDATLHLTNTVGKDCPHKHYSCLPSCSTQMT